MRTWLLPLVVTVMLGAGCTGRQVVEGTTRAQLPVTTELGQFSVEYAPDDTRAAQMVRTAIERAAPELLKWGRLTDPVTVFVIPERSMLEAAIGKSGYDFLRAWARYDDVYLESPTSWNPVPATQDQLDRTVLHELTHTVMYQASATRTTWKRSEFPLWFLEGMASNTARDVRQSMLDVSRYLRRDDGAEVLLASDEVYRRQSAMVYSAAHHAFGFLVERYGEDKVRELLGVMRRDTKRFPQAFEETIGIAPNDFVEEFRRYATMGGFKQARPSSRSDGGQ